MMRSAAAVLMHGTLALAWVPSGVSAGHYFTLYRLSVGCHSRSTGYACVCMGTGGIRHCSRSLGLAAGRSHVISRAHGVPYIYGDRVEPPVRPKATGAGEAGISSRLGRSPSPAAHAELRQGRVMAGDPGGPWPVVQYAMHPDLPIHTDQSPSYYWDRSMIPGRAFYGQTLGVRRRVLRDMHIDRYILPADDALPTYSSTYLARKTFADRHRTRAVPR